MSSIIERISMRSFGVVVGSALFLNLFLISPSYAQVDYYWIGGTGSWNDPANWNLNAVPGTGALGNSTDTAYLVSSDATDRTVYYSPGSSLTNLLSMTIDSTGQGTMTLSDFGSTGFNILVTGGGPPVAVGVNGPVIVNQSGGSFQNMNGMGLGSAGIWNLSGGLMNFRSSMGVGGTLNVTGGRAAFLGLYIGGSGTVNLGGTGEISAEQFVVRSTVNQSGGSTSGSPIMVYSGGTYNLRGGWAGTYTLENGGTFNQSGGHAGGGVGTQNDGTYNLSGGVFGGGTAYNSGTFNYSGGELGARFTNLINGTTNLSGTGTRTIDGDVVNNGTFKVTGTTAVYTGTFTNNGAYISDPAKNYFTNLTIGTTGYLTGGAGDEFHFSGDFLNHSQNPLWNTAMTDLFFGPGTHTFFLGDAGSSFTWDDLTLDLGTTLDLEGGAYFHVDTLHVFDLAQLAGLGHISYDILDIESVPEPITLLLLGSGLIGLVGFRRKFKK